MARISGALGRSCYVEVHETAEISPLPARGTNPRAHGQGRTAGPYTHAEMQRRARARVPTERYARRMTVNLPHLVHQSVSHHY